MQDATERCQVFGAWQVSSSGVKCITAAGINRARRGSQSMIAARTGFYVCDKRNCLSYFVFL